MAETFSINFDTASFTGKATINTGLFINGKWVEPIEDSATVDVVNPANSKLIATVSIGSAEDVNIATTVALQAYKTAWGLKCPGPMRAKLLSRLADLIEINLDEFAALEAVNVGKPFLVARGEITAVVGVFRYYSGWADKLEGKTIETNEMKFAYTRHEPYGVVGLIAPWNFPMIQAAVKIAPALATGNAIVFKPSELTPLTALKLAGLTAEAGFPPGVFNVVNGYGPTIGAAIASHMQISKLTFTGSTLVGRSIMRAVAESNLKHLTLELGGKTPSIIFDDADLSQAVKWAGLGVFHNVGQSCIAGSRIFVQEGIYDAFLEQFTQLAKALTSSVGDPFEPGTQLGPLISQAQLERVTSYIASGKQEGATIHLGGERIGNEGYFIQPTIFTNVSPEMKIVREEIFGPVASIIKFSTEEEVIDAANDTVYGLASNVFSQNISRALRVAHALEAGTTFVNSAHNGDQAIPFGGYKQSGIGREHGQEALNMYTQVKAVHVNLGV